MRYDLEKPKSHTADQPTAMRGRNTEYQQSHDIRKTLKVKQSFINSVARFMFSSTVIIILPNVTNSLETHISVWHRTLISIPQHGSSIFFQTKSIMHLFEIHSVGWETHFFYAYLSKIEIIL